MLDSDVLNQQTTNKHTCCTLKLSRLFLVFVALLLYSCFKTDTPPGGMIHIPAGEFIMGSNKVDTGDKGKKYFRKVPFYLDEHPERSVFLGNYYIDTFEVTVFQFSQFTPDRPFTEERKNHPVTLVAWHDADRYCKWLGKRLPTEAEWEKAARGTDGREYPWGNIFDPLKTNMGTDSHDTTPVGSYEKGRSPYGVYDMAGNVWEWTSDWYKGYPGGSYTSTLFGEKLKVIRGGAKTSAGHYNLPHFFRSAHRFGVPPENKAADTGFRCVKNK